MRLFDEDTRFKGLPEQGFQLFAMADREARRRAILETIHPALSALGQDLLEHLGPRATHPLHGHLPRLDWPRGYQPFCTWLALSRKAQGYQTGPQLNVGVHADHVAVRLGWDTSSVDFGRFEFLGRHGSLGPAMVEVAAEAGLRFAVYAAAPWPQGSTQTFESKSDLPATFNEVSRRGVWWELGRRFDLPESEAIVCSNEIGSEAMRIFARLLPVYERIEGDVPGES